MSRCLNCDAAIPSVEDFCSGSCQEEYTTAKQQRAENWVICQHYIERTGSLPEAKALAKSEGVVFNTSVWITAFGKMLAHASETPAPPKGGEVTRAESERGGT